MCRVEKYRARIEGDQYFSSPRYLHLMIESNVIAANSSLTYSYIVCKGISIVNESIKHVTNSVI